MESLFRALVSFTILWCSYPSPGLPQPPPEAGRGVPEVIIPQASRPSAQVQRQLDRMLSDYAVLELPLAAMALQVRELGRLDLDLGGQVYPLELSPNDLRSPGYRAVVMVDGRAVDLEPGPVTTFAGRVSGDPTSVVRLTVAPRFFAGYIKTDQEWIFLDPLRDYAAAAGPGQVVVYRDADVRPEAGGECGSEHLRLAARDLLPSLPVAKAHNTLRRMDIATDADAEYFQLYGVPGTFNRIAAVINGVDGIFRSQINLFLNITFQQVWTNPASDPYTTNDIGTTLSQFTDWWNANRPTVNRDVAHLFAGKDFSGNFIGLAFLTVVCNNPSFSYALSQDLASSFLRVELLAHEIGHNLSAAHDDQAPVCPGVSCNGFGPIMCSIIQSNGSNTFSSCSKSAINNHTHNNGSCLN